MSFSKVIVVDLDNTLILTDTLHEEVLALVRKKPFMLFLLLFWLFRGVLHLKLKVAENSVLDVTTLPYNLSLIDWLKEQKVKGKKIILCTAANERIAQAVFKHLGLFDDVITIKDYSNLKINNKCNVLQKKYGELGYDYAGNSGKDLAVWASASQAIVVNANERVQKKLSQVALVSKIFPSKNIGVSDWFRALRLYQWVKNLLLFVPLLASHQFGITQSLATLAIAFISFSLCASSVYITNDLLDLESDRSHPRKKNRPFASARLPIALGMAIVPLLIGVSILLGTIVGNEFLVVLLLYLLLTVAYSLVLKLLVLVDCITLATLYTIRIIAGGVAVGVSISFWLLAFSVFIFLSLALVKRYAELLVQIQNGKSATHGRGYLVSDVSLLLTLGVSSGYISALILALYFQSEDVVSLYAHPMTIWIVFPMLLFWISWVWLKAARGEMHDDPIVFAIKDKTSLFVATTITLVFVYSLYGMVI